MDYELCADTRRLSRREWLEMRRNGIGGSDAAAILGLNAYSSPTTVYYDKAGRLPEADDTEAMRQGRDLEAYVARRFEESTGKKVRRRNAMLRSKKWPFMLADLDRVVIGENAGLECKTTSVLNKSDFEAGEIPPPYYVQCCHYMAVCGFPRMYLAVLVLNRGFYWFTIERDDAEISALAETERAFWENNVLAGVPSAVDGSDATRRALDAIYPRRNDGGDTVNLLHREAAVKRLFEIQAKIKGLERDEAAVKNQLIADLGGAAHGLCGAYGIEYAARQRVSIDRHKLEQDFPDAYAACAAVTESRTFRLTTTKHKEGEHHDE